MSFKTYVFALLATIAGIVLGCAVLNRVVDPFWYYGDISIDGFNREKPRFARFSRQVKPQLLSRLQPEAIVIGSSLSEIGFDPSDASFTRDGDLRGFNFAFAGASWKHQQCHLRHALQSTKLKRVVIGIHPGPLPLADCARELEEIASFSQLPLLFSLSTARHAIATLQEQQPGSSTHTRDGRYTYARGAPGTLDRFREFYERRMRAEPRCRPEVFMAQPPTTASDQGMPQLGAGEGYDLEGLRWLVRTAREQGIALRIFAYPAHASWLELDYLCGDPDARWRELFAAARLVEEESRGADIQLWSFYAYKGPMTESLFKAVPTYWQDPEHFNYELGSMLFRDMFGDAAAGVLGNRLRPETLRAAALQFAAERKRYYELHPGYAGELRKIYLK